MKKRGRIKKKILFKGICYLYITSSGVYFRKDKIDKGTNIKIYHIKKVRLPRWIEILFGNIKSIKTKENKK